MKTFTLHGASDDLIETSGLPGCDEFNVIANGPLIASFHIKSAEGSLRINCIYDGHWCFAIGAIDGDYDVMPDWAIRRTWGKMALYSEYVEIDCPDDARLTNLKKYQ